MYEPKNWWEFQNVENPQEKQNWFSATLEEIKSLRENNTLVLVISTQGKKITG